jgi:hypothetical protein
MENCEEQMFIYAEIGSPEEILHYSLQIPKFEETGGSPEEILLFSLE